MKLSYIYLSIASKISRVAFLEIESKVSFGQSLKTIYTMQSNLVLTAQGIGIRVLIRNFFYKKKLVLYL